MSKILQTFSLFDWGTLVYAMAAIVLFTEMARRRSKGQDVSPIFTLMTVAAVLIIPVWQLVFSESQLLTRLLHTLLDFSVGMFAGVVYSVVLNVPFRRQLIGAILFALLIFVVYFGYWILTFPEEGICFDCGAGDDFVSTNKEKTYKKCASRTWPR